MERERGREGGRDRGREGEASTGRETVGEGAHVHVPAHVRPRPCAHECGTHKTDKARFGLREREREGDRGGGRGSEREKEKR